MIDKKSNPLQDTPTESVLRIASMAIYTLLDRGEDLKKIYTRMYREEPDNELRNETTLLFWSGTVSGIFAHMQVVRDLLNDKDSVMNEEKYLRLIDKINEELRIYA